ncbi:PEP-CTERM sorting domain-containing protein [Duganella callida]|uniref:PEP-CTERM sorting domain-containing protein n=1 Tax=Duganella callida TaxID=2561932 RepID=A0A4Y9SJW9_9BURK|nr:PEP-CTERM sorting domain-containing protein [Duganella callida]TFW21327.1 PEP-CTERM sorting domain-containing protein [Duganella callida]
MSKYLAAGAALALALAAPAQAEVHTYNFEATVYSLAQYTSLYQAVTLNSAEAAGGGATVSLGQKITGQFTIDTGKPADDVFTLPGVSSSYSHWSNGSLSYSFQGNSATYSTVTYTNSFNFQSTTTADRFAVAGGNATLNTSLWFQDLGKTAFANGMPTGTLSLKDLSNSGLDAAWYGANGSVYGLQAQFDSLTLAAAVPEPGTWALLTAGLALLGMAARRKRSC